MTQSKNIVRKIGKRVCHFDVHINIAIAAATSVGADPEWLCNR